jgi:hypothetical protein
MDFRLAVLLTLVTGGLGTSPSSRAEEQELAETGASDDSPQASGFSQRRSRIGYTEVTPVFAGPNSPQGDIEETVRELHPAFRFPKSMPHFSRDTTGKSLPMRNTASSYPRITRRSIGDSATLCRVKFNPASGG